MSTPTHPAPAPTAPGTRPSLPGLWVHLLGLSVLALALWLFYGSTAISQDTIVYLDWARDLSRGDLPDYREPFAPTPHPLTILVLAFASLFGNAFGYIAAVAVAYLAFATLLWAVLLLGRRLFGIEVGLLAVAALLLSREIALRGVLGQADVAAAAIVLLALLVALSDQRRETEVFVLLLIAGLLRPEPWLLSGAYWLYLTLTRGGGLRLRQAALGIAAPTIWILSDLAVTGDPTFSARITHGVGEALGVKTGAENIWSVLRYGIELVLGPEMLVAAGVGLGIGLVWFRPLTVVPAALVMLWILSFAGLGLAGLPLLERFLFVPATLLSLFAAFAMVGHIRHGQGRARGVWAAAGLALLVAVAVRDAPVRAEAVWLTREDTRRQGRAIRDLRALADADVASQTVIRCDRLVLPNTVPRQWAAYAFDMPRSKLIDGRGLNNPNGAYLQPDGGDSDALIHSPFNRATSARRAPPAGARRVITRRSWSLYERGCP